MNYGGKCNLQKGRSEFLFIKRDLSLKKRNFHVAQIIKLTFDINNMNIRILWYRKKRLSAKTKNVQSYSLEKLK